MYLSGKKTTCSHLGDAEVRSRLEELQAPVVLLLMEQQPQVVCGHGVASQGSLPIVLQGLHKGGQEPCLASPTDCCIELQQDAQILAKRYACA